MDVFISLIISIFEEGFIYGIMAIGVYITYKVLDFPDLTVDGSFPLGMCLTGLLISVGEILGLRVFYHSWQAL